MAVNAIASSSDLFAKCTPVYGTGSNRCGGLTMYDASATIGSELSSIYNDVDGKFRIWGHLIEADFMGRACQVKQNVLYNFLMDHARGWGAKKIDTTRINDEMREVVPFVTYKRKGIINANYWTLNSGTNSSGTSPGGVAYSVYFDIQSQTTIPADVRWFAPKTEVYINSKSSGGLVARTQWTVVDAAVQSATVLRIYCLSVNANSNLISGKLEFPTSGMVSRGTPNVNDYESYCSQIPGLNTNQRALAWVKDTRWTFCVDEQTDALFKLLRENNPAFREFGEVESVEMNRQIAEDYQKRFVEDFFWGKALANQTLNGYRSLPLITALDGTNITNYMYLPGVTGRVIGRRANAVGIYEQLAECGRVKDLGGVILNIPELLQEIYHIVRTRQSNGIESSIIELITDSSYAVQLKAGLFRYKNARFEGALRVNVNESDLDKVSQAGFFYSDFKIDYPAVTLRIVTHYAFDDLLDAHARSGSGLDNIGRLLLILDLGNSIYSSIIESNTQTNTTGDISALSQVNADALCRMKVPRRAMKHNSVKFTTVVDCPGSSLWIENIGPGIPEHCGTVGSVTDLAGDIP